MSKDENKEICKHCRHFLNTDVQQGICRRYPPQLFVAGMSQQGAVMGAGQPTTAKKSTCGEYSPDVSALDA